MEEKESKATDVGNYPREKGKTERRLEFKWKKVFFILEKEIVLIHVYEKIKRHKIHM